MSFIIRIIYAKKSAKILAEVRFKEEENSLIRLTVLLLSFTISARQQ